LLGIGLMTGDQDGANSLNFLRIRSPLASQDVDARHKGEHDG